MCVMVVSELGQQNSSKFLVYTESTRSNDFPSQDEASHTTHGSFTVDCTVGPN